MMTEPCNVANSAALAAAYCRLHDAERALEHARAAFETELIGASAGDVDHARLWELPQTLAAPFLVAVRETLARRLSNNR